MSYFKDVKEFHRLFESVTDAPIVLPSEDWSLRIRLILEELSETATAQASGDLEGFADGLVDLVYVVLGTAVKAGIPFDILWDEVHAANMKKKGSKIDASGKVTKPQGWKPPRSVLQLIREGEFG